MKQNSNVRSANRLAIVFDGKQIGALQSCRSSDDYGLEGVYGIGDIDPVEHVPTAARYTLSVSNVVFKTSQMRAAGLIPKNGQDALKGLVFDVEQYDKDSGRLIVAYRGCSYASGDMDVSRNAIVMSNASFMALTKTDNEA